jgi:hypothetical protein
MVADKNLLMKIAAIKKIVLPNKGINLLTFKKYTPGNSYHA